MIFHMQLNPTDNHLYRTWFSWCECFDTMIVFILFVFICIYKYTH